MSYPILPQAYESTERRVSGREVSRATNGNARGRTLYTSQKRAFKVVHEFVSTANKVAVEAFYSANGSNAFNFTWAGDSTIYSCIFDETDPVYVPLAGGLWHITVTLVQA